MPPTIDPEAPKLCNNCLIREQKRTSNHKVKVRDTVDILIRCPKETQIEIEEYCINEGIDFSRYFLELHYARIDPLVALKELKDVMHDPKDLSEETSDFVVAKKDTSKHTESIPQKKKSSVK